MLQGEGSDDAQELPRAKDRTNGALSLSTQSTAPSKRTAVAIQRRIGAEEGAQRAEERMSKIEKEQVMWCHLR